MDDSVKTVNQNQPSAIQADQASQTQPQAVVQPVVPAGSVNKEAGPVGPSDAEFFKPTDAELQVSQELKEVGVEAKSDKPDLTFEHKELGLDHAGPNITVSTQSTASIKLPMSEEEIADKLKAGQDDDSGKWLAGLIQKIIRVVGL